MVTEKLYLEGQATWRKIWKERSSNKTAYLHHGCPACLLVCGHLDLTDRINFPLKALCVKACPIDYKWSDQLEHCHGDFKNNALPGK